MNPLLKARIENELRRIQEGPSFDEKPQGIGKVEFEVNCLNNAWEVIAKAREIMKVISGTSLSNWPKDEEWRRLLPSWFVINCAPEKTTEEAQKWLAWWKSLNKNEQYKVEREQKWSLFNWLYWMQPDNRQWFWWDVVDKTTSSFIIYVEVDNWPFPWGSLLWLLKASGANQVDSKES